MQVTKRDGRKVGFDRELIELAVEKAAIADGWGEIEARNMGRRIGHSVETGIANEGKYLIDIEHIQDVVEESLMTRYPSVAKTYILYREKRTKMRRINSEASVSLINEYVGAADWRVKENSNMGFSLQGLNNYISSDISAEYWLNSIYTEEIRKAHISGDMHIHDLGLLAPYTYFGKEVVVAKVRGEIKVVSFEQLYDLLEEDEVLFNEKDGAWAKRLCGGVEVLDKDGWVNVLRMVKKTKNKPMHFIKNRGGRSVIVTEDHPMITKKGEKEAKTVQKQEDFLFTVDYKRLLQKEDLFSIQEIDLPTEILRRGFYGRKTDRVCLDGEELTPDNVSEGSIVSVGQVSSCRKVKLTPMFGRFIGFLLAEGYLTYDLNGYRVSISSRSREELKRINEGLLEQGWSGRIVQRPGQLDGKDMFDLVVTNRFLRFLLEVVFQIKPGARAKTLPVDILRYNKGFVEGVICGILDGDGSRAGETGLYIRVASRTLVEQAAVVLPFLGLFPRDRNCEGVGSEREYNGRKIVQNFPIYGVGFRTKKEVDLPSEKYRAAKTSTRAWQDETVDEWHRVLNNDVTDIMEEHIYDITTESSTLVVNGMWNHNCNGWDLMDLLKTGFRGVAGKTSFRPPNNLQAALGQIVSFLFTLQGEAAGAQAFSSFDTLLAPFVRKDNLSYEQVKQLVQSFVCQMNVATRVGGQPAFTNITLDMLVPSTYRDTPVVIGGKEQDTTYGEYQVEMDMLNRAFAEIMCEGDADGRIFTFPIPTYNITKDFDWDSPRFNPVWVMSGKLGVPYFANFVNSDMSPDDARSMCCRLRLDNRELRKRGGGLFGANPLTGSMGVVTLNLPRLAYDAKTEPTFFDRLEKLMGLAKDSLCLKRQHVEEFTECGLYPYSRFYLREVKNRFDKYWANHFSTIGLVGMNEACLNLFGEGIASQRGKEFAERVLTFMRDKMASYQEETGDNFNLEASPAEGTSFRLALLDRRSGRDMVFANGKSEPGKTVYYTNSSQLPVGHTEDLFAALDHQDSLQSLYTGGTVLHGFLGEEVKDPETVKRLVKTITDNYSLPYFTLTPTFSVCSDHGYLSGEVSECPTCGNDTEVYSRVVGYYRPVSSWNEGKAQEFLDRQEFVVPEA